MKIPSRLRGIPFKDWKRLVLIEQDEKGARAMTRPLDANVQEALTYLQSTLFDRPHHKPGSADIYQKTAWETIIDALQQAEARAVAAEARYHELLLSVGNAYPGETRHETALRYIRSAESQDNPPDTAQEANKEKHDNQKRELAPRPLAQRT